MNLFQTIIQTTRKGTGARATLITKYAEEQGVTLRTAYRRIYHHRDHLDAAGNFLRPPRKDKGTLRIETNPKLLAALVEALRNKELTYAAIARAQKVSRHVVRAIDRRTQS